MDNFPYRFIQSARPQRDGEAMTFVITASAYSFKLIGKWLQAHQLYVSYKPGGAAAKYGAYVTRGDDREDQQRYACQKSCKNDTSQSLECKACKR
jgi:hypothetical protein